MPVETLLDAALALLALSGSAAGFMLGKRGRRAQTDNLSVAASQAAVSTMLQSLTRLEAEVAELRDEVALLTAANSALLEENETLYEALGPAEEEK